MLEQHIHKRVLRKKKTVPSGSGLEASKVSTEFENLGWLSCYIDHKTFKNRKTLSDRERPSATLSDPERPSAIVKDHKRPTKTIWKPGLKSQFLPNPIIFLTERDLHMFLTRLQSAQIQENATKMCLNLTVDFKGPKYQIVFGS